MLMRRLFRLPGSLSRDPLIDGWMLEQPADLAAIARQWYDVMRHCGSDVREVLHDNCPTACVGDAAFSYVAVYTAHVNVGFFSGAVLDDPERLLVGTGKYMRHVKLRPGGEVDASALHSLIQAAYVDVKRRIRTEAQGGA